MGRAVSTARRRGARVEGVEVLIRERLSGELRLLVAEAREPGIVDRIPVGFPVRLGMASEHDLHAFSL